MKQNRIEEQTVQWPMHFDHNWSFGQPLHFRN